MKGLYRNASVAMEPDPDLYRRVFEALPEAWIEDPGVADDTIELLDRHRDRITWDEPIHSVADIEALPWRPRLLNLKPARFGSVRRLFETYDFCATHGIGAYGGGMFEQGPGRGQLQYLASLFHPDGPNDLAPGDVQPAGRRGRPAPLAARAGAARDRLPLGDLRPAAQHPRAAPAAGVGERAGPCYRWGPMSRVSGVAEQVRVMILRGEIGLGEPIVDERLQQQLRVRRGLLREALRRLEGEGILVASHSGAMRVIAIDRDALRETVQARAALEALSAGLAARRFAPAPSPPARGARCRRWPTPRTRPPATTPRSPPRWRTATSTGPWTPSAPTAPPNARSPRSGTG